MEKPEFWSLLARGASRPGPVHVYQEGTIDRRDLWALGAVASRSLRAKVGAEGSVAAVLTTTIPCLAFLFGAWRSGLRLASLPLPMRGMSPEDYAAQIAQLCDLVEADTLAVDAAHLDLIPPDLGVRVVSYQDLLRGGAPAGPDGAGSFVQFTSGSTSAPKGIHLGPNAIAACIDSTLQAIDVGCDDVPVSWLPLSHDMGLIGMWLCGWCQPNRATVLIPPERFLANPSVWLRLCSEFRGTITTAPNFGFELSARQLARAKGLDLSSLRVCITGAEPARVDTIERFCAAAREFGFDETALCPAYGLAEATLTVTLTPGKQRWRSLDLDSEALGEGRVEPAPPERSTRLVGSGPPVPGIQVRIVGDSEPGDGSHCGEILIKGDSLLTEYLGDVPERWVDGWWATNDLGFLADGQLYVAGRADDLLIVRGRNLYATDLEAAAQRIDVVRVGTCAAVDDGAGSYAIVAESRNEDLSEPELDDGARDIQRSLAVRFGAGPGAVVFVRRGTLQKTPSGKVQRKKIGAALCHDELKVQLVLEFAR